MKKIIPKGLILGFALALSQSICTGQNHDAHTNHQQDGQNHYHDHQGLPMTITENAENFRCVTDEDYYAVMMPLLQESYAKLKADNLLEPRDFTPKNIGTMQWPLRMSSEYASLPGASDYYTIWNYADLQSGTGRKDWMCATGSSARNYDGHNGVDIVPHPFRWKMQYDGSVDVVAAASGEILFFQDGNFDKNCGGSGHIMGTYPGYGHYGNFVALIHPDNSITLYGHMKNGSIPAFTNGQSISQGEYLGKVGSSGNSSDPHLHFEARECINCSFVEPWFTNANTCNTTVDNSWWDNQTPYWDTSILRVMTHSSTPLYSDCNGYEAGYIEEPNVRNHFGSTSVVYVGVYLRDFLNGQLLTVRIRNQANTILRTWTATATQNYGSGYNFLGNHAFVGASSGTYKVEAILDGKTTYHYFTINCTSSYSLSGAVSGGKGWIASSTISSTQTMTGSSANNLVLEAGTSITLNPGFWAQTNSQFLANINSCSLNGAIAPYPYDDDPEVINELSSLQIFPNPNRGQFTVRAEYDGDHPGLSITVRNSLGQVVAQRNLGAGGNLVIEDFDVRNMAAGVYFVEYKSDNHQQIQKVIIQ